MTLIMGLNLPLTTRGLRLMDTGAALIDENGIRTAIAQERITREKYGGGIKESIDYVLNANKLKLKDVDYFVASICCDHPPTKEYALESLKKEGVNIPKNKLIIASSHHMSHAAAAFYTSGFDNALIFIADGEGNILNPIEFEFHANSIERTSYYVGKGNKIKMISRDSEDPGDLGIGMCYGYFTQWMGYPNYQSAGNVMGLAPYGNPKRFKKVKMFDIIGDKIVSYLEPNLTRTLSVRRLIHKQTGKEIGINSLESTKNPNQLQKDMAFLIQSQMEKIVIKRIKRLIKKTGVRNLVISGGVGLNCVLNGKLLKKAGIKNLYVFPASGDTGQSLGNAIWAAFNIFNFKDKSKFKLENNYFGKRYNDREIVGAIKSFGKKIKYEKLGYEKLLEKASEDISKGKIVFWFQERSELGPRALGNRSILADPRSENVREHLNSKVKLREWFRPYCPSVLEEFSNDYFDIKYSPFMNIAVDVKKNKRKLVPAITHVDGTSRVHTVSRDQNPLYYDLIKKFYEKTGIPILLNTSFNCSGEPIVETPKDAIKSYLKMNGDVLVLGNYLIEKN